MGMENNTTPTPMTRTAKEKAPEQVAQRTSAPLRGPDAPQTPKRGPSEA